MISQYIHDAASIRIKPIEFLEGANTYARTIRVTLADESVVEFVCFSEKPSNLGIIEEHTEKEAEHVR